ncbi:MAG: UDP-N-acetylglucosamine--N-acetylmuramyl-(pentapeptide) pyrophosphoryl-undecaprenol N-acetylglucosamine transferase [Planctomycetes bacterium]|nr:UDP-N-acetylglucosamine--N-acetylmuramyl-(pentapeptide) pyrophosphoryl-undecaprenol N-acetylglucosamine transferase [Planctomycetota bacterium]
MQPPQQPPPNVLIAGGGSGGHVAPAIAAAQSLSGEGASVILAHSDRKIDMEMLCDSPFDGIVLPAVPFSINPLRFIRFCARFLRASKKIRSIIKERNITCVLATGGFVAAPALHGARKIGCKTVLLNLDNPAGKANKLAVRWADVVLSTVECDLLGAILIPPPLRKCVISDSLVVACKKKFGLNPNRMTLLVTGASQGASTINALLPELAKKNAPCFHGWEILHIAGTTHIAEVEQAWKEANVPCKVLGFTHSMGDAWGAADLAITRGGANTIAEIAMNAIPTIVMPYPYHEDEHQRSNATPLERLGGVVIATDHKELALNLDDAGSIILQLLKEHHQRFTMRQAMLENPPINGADAIATFCLNPQNPPKPQNPKTPYK